MENANLNSNNTAHTTPSFPEPQKTNPWAIPISIVLAGALIAGAVYFSSNGEKSAGNPTQPTSKVDQIKKIDSKDHTLGNPNATISIIEYSDLQCPYCQEFHNSMNEIMKTYGIEGKISWTYRHFWKEKKLQDGSIFHPLAGKSAEATECVAELGGNDKFWAYIDAIFKGQNTGSLNRLSEIAVEIGVDKNSFDQCLASGKYTEKVAKSYEEGRKYGVSGTPNSFILVNGKPADFLLGDLSSNPSSIKGFIPGAYPIDSLKDIIDSLL